MPDRSALGRTFRQPLQLVRSNEDGLSALPATATSVTVPAEFMRGGTDYKYEVLAIEVSGNQTLATADFATR